MGAFGLVLYCVWLRLECNPDSMVGFAADFMERNEINSIFDMGVRVFFFSFKPREVWTVHLT